MRLSRTFLAVVCACIAGAPATALADDAGEMQKMLQNPLANIRALMTDNFVAFDTGINDDVSWGLNLQYYHALYFPDKRFAFLPRLVLPVMGLEPGARVPPVGQVPGPPTASRSSGIGDAQIQLYYAPSIEGNWKYGVGPVVSMPTASKEQLEGAQWGGGAGVIITGPLAKKTNLALIVANVWGNSGKFNTMTIQPIVSYDLVPGSSLLYNAIWNANWEASSGDRWTVPLGLSYNKTWDMGGGHGLDFVIGPYYNVVRPDGSARWQINSSINWLFP
ncbi:MAG: hypothetical protein R3308_08890 [Thiohalobacterales bacterium]|nr:hypothetical protein [Thiohalobacterales bacterium]